MAQITFAGAAAAHAFPGESTMLTLKIYNNTAKAIAGIRAQFLVLGNDLGTDAGTVECGYALGSKDSFADISINAAVTETIAAYLVPPATLTGAFAPGVRAVPLYIRYTVKYSDGSLFAFESALENVSVLNYRYVPRIGDFALLRSIGGEENDEGIVPMATLKLALRDSGMTSFMSLKLHYAENGSATSASPYIDLTAEIPGLLEGAENDTELIPQTFSNGSDWAFLLVFGDEYESASARRSFFRAFANLHLSGCKTGGACFGGFSRSQYAKPMLESHYEGVFHRGIRGISNFAQEEIPTGGRWIDNKPLYRRIISGSVKASATTVIAEGIDFETLIRLEGFLKYTTSAGLVTQRPLNYYSSSSVNTRVFAQEGKIKVYSTEGGDVTVIMEYTRAADAPIEEADGYAAFTDSAGEAFLDAEGSSFKTEVY